jgi:hypothetical protein
MVTYDECCPFVYRFVVEYSFNFAKKLYYYFSNNLKKIYVFITITGSIPVDIKFSEHDAFLE